MDTDGAVSPENLNQALIDIAVESWRFSRLFARALTKLDAGDAFRYSNQLRYYLKNLDESLGKAGMQIANLERQPYDPCMAATALNVADFGPDDHLWVEQMVEPVLLGPVGLLRPGTVMLRKVER